MEKEDDDSFKCERKKGEKWVVIYAKFMIISSFYFNLMATNISIQMHKGIFGKERITSKKEHPPLN